MKKVNSILKGGRVIVCVGSGGVGKTTLSAAIALHGALEGKRSAVITIDPARRLANALGLNSLENDPHPIPWGELQTNGTPGTLSAMMLDTKRTFDLLIEKYAPSREIAKKILSNRYYQHLSTALIGSHEYMAMEKLQEIYQQSEFDLCVLDTPPSRHALDFIETPQKMLHLIDESILRWIFLPSKIVGRSGMKALQKGAAFFLKTAEKLTGFEILKDLSEFALNFEGMYEGFRERAQKIDQLLHSKETIFLIVTAPQPGAIEEALFFHQQLSQAQIPCGGFIVNRVHRSYLSANANRDRIPSLDMPDANLEKELLENLRNLEILAQRDSQQIDRLRKETDLPLLLIPEHTSEIVNLPGIKKLLDSLLSS
ncbi:MAG: ArsA family ATPase [Deltaproteobacteria bacterium]|nr:ArsA family ATPase [Deltaproteobacteria bacterium]